MIFCFSCNSLFFLWLSLINKEVVCQIKQTVTEGWILASEHNGMRNLNAG